MDNNTNIPTVNMIAAALDYIETEFDTTNGFSLEMFAEGLAFGQHRAIDALLQSEAARALTIIPAGDWARVMSRAKYLKTTVL
jgi:hypothetical protein